MDKIKLHGVKIHNIEGMDMTIPKNQLVVITGVSGSGKSSLAFDVLFEEGKNQYLRLLGILSGLEQEAHFKKIEGIGPAIAIKQSVTRQSNPRSTVGSKTKLLNSLALMYASDGKYGEREKKLSPGEFLYTTVDGMCSCCNGRGCYDDVDLEKLIPEKEITLEQLYAKLKVTAGYLSILRKKLGEHFKTPFWKLPESIKEEVVYGRFENGKQSYCIERLLKNAKEKGEDVEQVYHEVICPECQGERVNDSARAITLGGKRIGELGNMTLNELEQFVTLLETEALSTFSKQVIKKMKENLNQLIHFRLGHLSLYRNLSTLSGGELQRLFLHLYLESGLDSLIYVFDEPMAGLHASEKGEMIRAVKRLRDLGNTVIVVEHDETMIKEADHIIEIGPKAGIHGGKVVFEGNYKKYLKAETLLSNYLSGKTAITCREKRVSRDASDQLIIEHANTHYLKNLTVKIPLHQLVGIAGLSGSGKSSLIEDTLLTRLATYKKFGKARGLYGGEKINSFIKVSQEPIGRNASSTPASYIGIWDKIRALFAGTEEAKERGLEAGYFSFHSKGACKTCGGSGYEKIYLTSTFSVDKKCPSCEGKRYQKESLMVRYKGKRITDILEMSIEEATDFFMDQSGIRRPLEVLTEMGMGYLTLGQPTSSLSGGEAQRLKLAKALGKSYVGNSLYVLDEPTTGLSLYDVDLLLKVLSSLVEKGNSVIVIEHHIKVLQNCDHIIELGPKGGNLGGELIAEGAPEALSKNKNSITGRYLI